MRPAAYIVKLSKDWFPHTKFQVRRSGEDAQPSDEGVDSKSITELVLAGFCHGDEVCVQVSGRCETMAAEFFKIVWENLEGYTDDERGVKARLAGLIDDAFLGIDDPDLIGFNTAVFQTSRKEDSDGVQECRAVATINDHLHNLSLPMLPLIAKHFDVGLQIAFELTPSDGIFSFGMNEQNGFELDYTRILRLNVEIGTRITVLTRGTNRVEANTAVTSVLRNLWQCDDWIRQRPKGLESDAAIVELLAFAKSLGRFQSPENTSISNPYISNLLSPRRVFMNNERSEFSKQGILRQLLSSQVQDYGLDMALVLKGVQDAERREQVVLREGFALAHGAVERTPRVAISFGVYRKGVVWDGANRVVRLVCMVLVAKDCYGTWRDYLRKMGILFSSNRDLQEQLIQSRDSEDFCATLRCAEKAMVK